MTNKLFTYVSDDYIEEFLSYKSSYADIVAFLGSSGQIVARDNIYGFSYKDLAQVIDDESSYLQAASAKAVNDRISEVETVAAEALYDLNSQVQEMETVTANALYDLNDRIENIDISEQLDEIYDTIGDVSSNVNELSINVDYSIDNILSYIDDLNADIEELDLTASSALYDLNSRLETIDMVAGEAIIRLYSYVDEIRSTLANGALSCDISYVASSTVESVNGKPVMGVVIPIDASEDLNNGGVLSYSYVKPWTSPSDKHLELKLGEVMQDSYFIVDCKLVGECMHSQMSAVNDHGIMKMWPMLPLDMAITTASQVMVKYYENKKIYEARI